MQELFFCFISENGFAFGIFLIFCGIVIIFGLLPLIGWYGIKLIRWIIRKKLFVETDKIEFKWFGVDLSFKGRLAYVVAELLIILLIVVIDAYLALIFFPCKMARYSIAMDAPSRPKTLLQIKQDVQEETESKIEISPLLRDFEVIGSFSGKCVPHLFKLISDHYNTEIECEWSLRKRALSLSPAEKGAFADKLIFFDKDSANLTHSEEKKLTAIVQHAKNQANITLVLHGYSDDTGSKDYNNKLISRRINTVKNYLLNEGVSTTRILVGEMLVIKSDKDSRKKNRRVEIISR